MFTSAICYNARGMIDTFLVLDKTVVSAKGDGPSVDISGASNRVFLLTLNITGIVEQESLDVSGPLIGRWRRMECETHHQLSPEVLSGAASAAARFDWGCGGQVFARSLGGQPLGPRKRDADVRIQCDDQRSA